MSFPSNGTNHYNAIKNELCTKEYLEKYADSIYPCLEKKKYRVESKGGTTYKADNIIYSENNIVINISDKQKKNGISNGSYDYTNTSKPINKLLNRDSVSVKQIQSVLGGVKETKKLPKEERKKLVPSYRILVSEASNSFLNGISPDELTDLIKQYLIEPNKEMEMFITDNKMDERYTFPFIKHPVVELIKDGFIPSIKVKVGKMSGNIIFTKNNQEKSIGLRIRCHTNNGVSALLGLSNSNSNSQFVLKFQQDNVDKLIDTMGVSPIAI